MTATASIRRKGTDAAQLLQCLATTPDDLIGAHAVAEARGLSFVSWAIKSLVDPVASSGADAMRSITADLALAINEASGFGALQLAGANRVPFNTRVLEASSPAVAGWGGESTPFRGTAAGFTQTGLLDVLRVGALAVQSRELVAHSSPASTEIVRRLLINANALALDQALLDPSNAGVSGSKPKSIAFGAASFALASSSVASFDDAFRAAFNAITDHDGDLRSVVVLAHPRTVSFLATSRGTAGPAFPGVNAKSGGTIYGCPLIPTRGLPMVGSPSATSIAVVDASGITIADDSEADVSVTTQGAVELEDAPSGDGQNLLSLWQNNLVGLRVARYVNFARARSHSVAVITGVTV